MVIRKLDDVINNRRAAARAGASTPLAAPKAVYPDFTASLAKARMIAAFFDFSKFSFTRYADEPQDPQRFFWAVASRFSALPEYEEKIRAFVEKLSGMKMAFNIICKLPEPDYVRQLQDIANIDPLDKPGILETLANIDLARLREMLGVKFLARCIAVETEPERQISKYISENQGRIRSNIIAYYIYTNALGYLKEQLRGDDGYRMLDVVSTLNKLGRSDEALDLLMEIIDLGKKGKMPAAVNFEKPSLFLFKMLEVMDEIIPGVSSGAGFRLVVDHYFHDREIPLDQRTLALKNAAMFYPPSITGAHISNEPEKVVFNEIIKAGQNERSRLLIIPEEKRAPARLRERESKIVEEKPVKEPMRRQRKGLGVRITNVLKRAIGNVDDGTKTDITPAAPVMIERDPDADKMLSAVREMGRLLITRNIDLNELGVMARENCMPVNGKGVKYFRYGLGAEYGKEGAGEVLTVVMKPKFWEEEKHKTALDVRFIKDLGLLGDNFFGKMELEGDHVRITSEITDIGDQESILARLASTADYNRYLQEAPPRSWDKGKTLIGKTVLQDHSERFMGYFPQLNLRHDVSLDMVERILVPEHLWAQVNETLHNCPSLREKLQKIEGTGRDAEQFLHGREGVVRRSRAYGGGYLPNMGYEALFRFEQAYFQIVNEAYSVQTPSQAIVDYEWAGNMNFNVYPYRGWIFAHQKNKPEHSRAETGDWKIFVNPTADELADVLKVVAQVIAEHPESISVKWPRDLNDEWRPGRKFSEDPTAPKIVVYVNEESLPIIMRELEQRLGRRNYSHPGQAGPSFTKSCGSSGLLFYKKEYFDEDDLDIRAKVGNNVRSRARRMRKPDGTKFNEGNIRRVTASELEDMDFGGENYYKKKADYDPLV